MSKKVSQKQNPISILIFGAALVSLIITPDITYDPINTPKFSVVLILGGFALGLIQTKKNLLVSPDYKLVFAISTFFILWLGISFIFSPGNKVSQIYGVFGRHTGILTYIALTSIFIAVVLHVNNHLINLTTKIFISTGVFSVFYGYLQINQLDPIKWAKDSDRIVGTFANPNFYSSFIALTMIYVLSLSFSNKINYRLRIFSICYILAGFFLLVRVTSFQGFIVFLIGGSVVFLSLIRNLNKLRKRMLPIYVFFAVVLLSIILDILQKAPWISYLYKPSVSVRGDFWRASARIIEQYPLFGIGMDNFRSFYPVYRDMASLTHGEPTVADAAHNYFFDIGVGAGVPGLLAYILIVILTLFSANRILTRNQEFDYKIVGVIGCWVGFQAQSVISIGHLGLGIWGWVFSGIIIGSEICTRPPKLDSESKFINSNSVSYRSKYRVKEALLISSAGTLLGLGLSIPLLIGAINYQNAMREGDAIKLSSAATTWPQDTLLMSRTASFLITHGYPEIGISLAKNAAKLDPNFSVPWKILANSGQITEQEKNSIKKKIEKLDPLYQISEEYKLMSN